MGSATSLPCLSYIRMFRNNTAKGAFRDQCQAPWMYIAHLQAHHLKSNTHLQLHTHTCSPHTPLGRHLQPSMHLQPSRHLQLKVHTHYQSSMPCSPWPPHRPPVHPVLNTRTTTSSAQPRPTAPVPRVFSSLTHTVIYGRRLRAKHLRG